VSALSSQRLARLSDLLSLPKALVRARAAGAAARAGQTARAAELCRECLLDPVTGAVDAVRAQAAAARVLLDRVLADPRAAAAGVALAAAGALLRRAAATADDHDLPALLQDALASELATALYAATDAADGAPDAVSAVLRCGAFREDSLVLDARRTMTVARRAVAASVSGEGPSASAALLELLGDNNCGQLALRTLAVLGSDGPAATARVLARLADTAMGARPIDHAAAVGYLAASQPDDARTVMRSRVAAAGRDYAALAALAATGVDATAVAGVLGDAAPQYRELLTNSRWWRELSDLGAVLTRVTLQV
jgi:hypothetical protein